METNEAILAREVVIIDTHKKLGAIKDLRVDCDKMAVCHYIVNNDSTGSTLALPFEKALAVGDTFMTVQNRNDFLAADDAVSNKIINEGYLLLKEEVYSKTGNKLGPIKGYEFDTVQGTVTKILLENGSSYTCDTFIFFSPDFVFIDDGAPTAAELRADSGEIPQSTAVFTPAVPTFTEESFAEPQPEPAPAPEPTFEPEPAPVFATSVQEDVVVEPAVEDDDSTITDDEIIDFLIGATLQADVQSEDGQFSASQGTVLTREIIINAAEHDAILLLTINVEV